MTKATTTQLSSLRVRFVESEDLTFQRLASYEAGLISLIGVFDSDPDAPSAPPLDRGALVWAPEEVSRAIISGELHSWRDYYARSMRVRYISYQSPLEYVFYVGTVSSLLIALINKVNDLRVKTARSTTEVMHQRFEQQRIELEALRLTRYRLTEIKQDCESDGRPIPLYVDEEVGVDKAIANTLKDVQSLEIIAENE